MDFFQLLQGLDSTKFTELAQQNIGLALALCFVSGILTSFTPCIYPMIPITISIFGQAARKSSKKSGFNPHTFFIALIYVAGMCLTYSLMGVVAGLTGSLFGKILQSRSMLLFLALLFFTLGMGQMGLFKLALPGSIQTKLAKIGGSQSRFGIFLMGAISGLIVSPCVGPVVAGILAFIFNTSNPYLGFLYFLSFGMGLGVLFLAMGGFAGLLNALPRSGKWMVRINVMLGGLMFIAAAYYGQQWVKKGSQPTATSSLQWITQEREALKLAGETGKPIFLDFSAEWCEACHELDKYVFSKPAVQEKLKQFVLLRLDVTDSNEENVQTLSKYGVQSLPTLLILSSKGEELQRVNGYIEPQTLIPMLHP